MEHCRVFFLMFSSHLASPFFCLIGLNNGYTQNQEELSTRHLSDDFARVSLPQFTQDLQSSHHHNLPLESWHLNFSASSAWRPAIFFSRFPQGISFANLPGSPNDLSKLRLHVETQELEIKRLQPELQFAQIKLSPTTTTSTSKDGKGGNKFEMS